MLIFRMGQTQTKRSVCSWWLRPIDLRFAPQSERGIDVKELDDAARRRLERRLYIPLPETSARKKVPNTVQTLLMLILDH